MTQNFKMKAKAFIEIANCCKILKKFDCAIRILRKALEYGSNTDNLICNSLIY